MTMRSYTDMYLHQSRARPCNFSSCGRVVPGTQKLVPAPKKLRSLYFSLLLLLAIQQGRPVHGSTAAAEGSQELLALTEPPNVASLRSGPRSYFDCGFYEDCRMVLSFGLGVLFMCVMQALGNADYAQYKQTALEMLKGERPGIRQALKEAFAALTGDNTSAQNSEEEEGWALSDEDLEDDAAEDVDGASYPWDLGGEGVHPTATESGPAANNSRTALRVVAGRGAAAGPEGGTTGNLGTARLAQPSLPSFDSRDDYVPAFKLYPFAM